MPVVRFATETLRRECCDATLMGRQWGRDRARRISRRLQQIEAMTSLDDLAFMPFDSHTKPDGVIEIAVDHDLALYAQAIDHRQEDTMHTTITISAVTARSSLVK